MVWNRKYELEWMNHTLPYGKYIDDDGAEVLFNREYKQIYRRKDGIVTVLPGTEWTPKGSPHQFYYKDGSHPYWDKTTKKRCLNILLEWRKIPIGYEVWSLRYRADMKAKVPV
jgi:hypothetical protein